MLSRELFYGERCLDPENIDGAMSALSIEQRYGNPGCAIIERQSSVSTAHKAGVACCVAPALGLAEDLFELFGVAREPILWVIGSSQPSQDIVALLLRAPGEIGPSEG